MAGSDDELAAIINVYTVDKDKEEKEEIENIGLLASYQSPVRVFTTSATILIL